MASTLGHLRAKAPLMMLDATAIRRRREERGLSIRAVASCLGVAGCTVTRIEAGDNHPELTLGLVTKLVETLSMDVATMFPSKTPPAAQGGVGGDVEVVGALLHAAGVLTSAAALCEALEWDKSRLDHALCALDAQVRTVGLRLNRNPAGFSLVRAVEPCPAEVLTRLVRRHIARDGLNLTEASMLRRISTTGAPREPTNPEAVALGVLGNAGLVQHGVQATSTSQAPLVLADAVRFSLLLDEEPDEVPAPSPDE